MNRPFRLLILSACISKTMYYYHTDIDHSVKLIHLDQPSSRLTAERNMKSIKSNTLMEVVSLWRLPFTGPG